MKKLSNVLAAVYAAGGVWFAASVIDVAIHNTAAVPIYQAWNLFTLIWG